VADKRFKDAQRNSKPVGEARYSDNEQGKLDAALHITSDVGIARISSNNVLEAMPSISSPASERDYLQDELERRFDRSQPLRLDVLGFNGKKLTINEL
jgi:hypothetical protein